MRTAEHCIDQLVFANGTAHCAKWSAEGFDVPTVAPSRPALEANDSSPSAHHGPGRVAGATQSAVLPQVSDDPGPLEPTGHRLHIVVLAVFGGRKMSSSLRHVSLRGLYEGLR